MSSTLGLWNHAYDNQWQHWNQHAREQSTMVPSSFILVDESKVVVLLAILWPEELCLVQQCELKPNETAHGEHRHDARP